MASSAAVRRHIVNYSTGGGPTTPTVSTTVKRNLRRVDRATRCTGTPTPSPPTISVHVKSRQFAPNPPSQATTDMSEDPLQLIPSRLRCLNGFVTSDVVQKSFFMTTCVLHTKSRRFPACPFRRYLTSVSCPRPPEWQLSSRQPFG